MTTAYPDTHSADRFRRAMLMVIIVMALVGTLVGWYSMGERGMLSPVLDATQMLTTVVLIALLTSVWRRWLSQRNAVLCCLVYAAVICIACMALRMYSPTYGAGLDLKPLYLWIPVIYVFAFTLTNHKAGLVISLAIMALFVVVSLPYLVRDIDAPDANFTVQLHIVSGVLIVTLYFFARYQHRLRLAQVRMQRLAWLSNTDELTKLANRRRMAALIEAELARPDNRGRGLAVMLFDVDHFKTINDRHGHAAGDAAIVALAALAMDVFRGAGTSVGGAATSSWYWFETPRPRTRCAWPTHFAPAWRRWCFRAACRSRSVAA